MGSGTKDAGASPRRERAAEVLKPPDSRAGGPARGGTGELLELTISGVAHGGWCVARDSGGRVVFVRHALPGERVRARVTDATASFARAEAVEVLDASPDRAEPRCPHARPGGCGGCDWQHAGLAAQRRLKAEVISEQLRRIAGLDRGVSVEPVAGDEDGLGWRTRVRFSVSASGAAGLLAHRSHDVVEVGDCPIAHPLVRAASVTGRRWAGARSVEVAVSPASGERAVIVTTAARGTAAEGAAGAAGSTAGADLAGVADTVLVAGRGGRLTTLTGRGREHGRRGPGRCGGHGAGGRARRQAHHPDRARLGAAARRRAVVAGQRGRVLAGPPRRGGRLGESRAGGAGTAPGGGGAGPLLRRRAVRRGARCRGGERRHGHRRGLRSRRGARRPA
jgi:predicted RNA-binding protein with TRAM domain